MRDAVGRDAGLEGDDAGDVGRVGGQDHVAEYDLINLVGAQSGAAHRFHGGDPTKFLCGDGRERAVGLGERRAGAFENGDVEHGSSSRGVVSGQWPVVSKESTPGTAAMRPAWLVLLTTGH